MALGYGVDRERSIPSHNQYRPAHRSVNNDPCSFLFLSGRDVDYLRAGLPFECNAHLGLRNWRRSFYALLPNPIRIHRTKHELRGLQVIQVRHAGYSTSAMHHSGFRVMQLADLWRTRLPRNRQARCRFAMSPFPVQSRTKGSTYMARIGLPYEPAKAGRAPVLLFHGFRLLR